METCYLSLPFHRESNVCKGRTAKNSICGSTFCYVYRGTAVRVLNQMGKIKEIYSCENLSAKIIRPLKLMGLQFFL
jgi:hypothetical protein